MRYIFFEGDSSTGRILLNDLYGEENVRIIYKDRALKSRLMSILFKLHMSQKINRKIQIPFKSIYFKSLINYSFASIDGICFIFVAGWYSKELFIWLRKKYPKCKLILLLRDTIRAYEASIPSFLGRSLSKEFDLVITYNPNDAKMYGFLLSSVFFSKIDSSLLPSYPKSNLVFIGVAKDRLPLVHAIFQKIENAGFKCDFYLTKVDNVAQAFSGRIMYAKKPVPYIEYLGREYASECILEVIKGDTAGGTLRCWEAVYYNKKLLTNWRGIKEFQYYNPNFMHYFSTVDDIDIDFLKTNSPVDYDYNNENSPVHLLELIENNFSTSKGVNT